MAESTNGVSIGWNLEQRAEKYEALFEVADDRDRFGSGSAFVCGKSLWEWGLIDRQ